MQSGVDLETETDKDSNLLKCTIVTMADGRSFAFNPVITGGGFITERFFQNGRLGNDIVKWNSSLAEFQFAVKQAKGNSKEFLHSIENLLASGVSVGMATGVWAGPKLSKSLATPGLLLFSSDGRPQQISIHQLQKALKNLGTEDAEHSLTR